MNITDELELLASIRPIGDERVLSDSDRVRLLHRITDPGDRIQATPTRGHRIPGRRPSGRRIPVTLASLTLCAGLVVAGTIAIDHTLGRMRPAPSALDPTNTLTPDPPKTTTEPVVNAAYISERARVALAHTSDYVEVSDSKLYGGPDPRHPDRIQSWLATRADTFMIRQRGKFSDGSDQETGSVIAETQNSQITVRHDLRQWWSEVITSPEAVKHARDLVSSDLLPRGLSPQAIDEALARNGYTLAGTINYQGRKLLKLISSSTYTAPLATGPRKSWTSHDELLIDPQTYLPAFMSSGETYANGTEEKTLEVNFTWLPKTPANLMLLTVMPPQSYTHLPKPPAVTDDGHG